MESELRSEFEKDLQIDPNQLDVEAAQQGELFFKWAERAIEAKQAYERAKLRLDVKQAEISFEVRKDHRAFGLDKVTESAIDSTVRQNEDVLRHTDEMMDAKEAMLYLDKAVEAMEMKKRMIEVLITLHGQQYFAGPSVPRDLASAWLEKKNGREGSVVTKQVMKTRTRKNGPEPEHRNMVTEHDLE